MSNTKEPMFWFVDSVTKKHYKIYEDGTIEGFDNPLVILKTYIGWKMEKEIKEYSEHQESALQ